MIEKPSYIDTWDRTLLMIIFFLIPLENVLDIFFGITTIFKPYRIVIIISLVRAVLLMDRSLLMAHKRLKYIWIMYLVGTIVFFLRSFLFDVSLANFTNDITQILLLMLFINMYSNKIIFDKYINLIFASFCFGLLLNYLLLYNNVESAFESSRFAGFFTNPNTMGLCSSISIIFAITSIQKTNKIIVNVFWVLVIISSTIMLNETSSRTAILSILVSIGALIILKFSRKTVIIATLVFITFNITSYQLDLTNIRAYERHNLKNKLEQEDPRPKLFEAGLLSIKDTGGIGLGYGQFQYYSNFAKYMKPISLSIFNDRKKEKSGLGLHSAFLSAAVHGGIIALFFFLVFNFKLIKSAYFEFKKSDKERPFTLGLVLFAPLFIYSIFNEVFLSPVYWGGILIIEQLIRNNHFVRNSRSNRS